MSEATTEVETELVTPEVDGDQPAAAGIRAYSTQNLAKMFQVTTDTVRQWIRDEKIVAFKGDNGRWYVEREVALAYANKRWGNASA